MRLLIFVTTDQIEPRSEFALGLARAAIAAGHEALVVGCARGRTPPPRTPLGDEANARGLPFRILLERRRLDPGLVGQLEMIHRRWSPDAFVSFDVKAAILHRVARWRPETWFALKDEMPGQLECWLLGFADGVIVSRSELESLLKSKLKSCDKVQWMDYLGGGTEAANEILREIELMCTGR